MVFCSKCGTKLVNGAKFCQKCGNPTAIAPKVKNEQRQQEWSGKLIKCPNCGQVLKSFEIVCPACGHEFREIKASSAVKEFALKLEAIEARREDEKPEGFFAKLAADNKLSKTDAQKINLIKSFSIPNTKEDILEFMILASSCINTGTYDFLNGSSPTKGDTEINNAWLSKFKQAYEKARISFKGDPEFAQIEETYLRTSKELKKAQQAPLMVPLKIFGALMIILIVLLIILAIIPQKPEAEQRQLHLEYVLEQIEDDISNGKYRDAYNKAYTLIYDEELDPEKHEYWEKKRQETLELIEEVSDGRFKADSTSFGEAEEDVKDSNGFVAGFKEGIEKGLDNSKDDIDEFLEIIGKSSSSNE